jgi:hypothetical protein
VTKRHPVYYVGRPTDGALVVERASEIVSAYFPYCCLLLRASACYYMLLPAYSVLLIVYLNVLDFSFKIKTTTF